MSWVEVVVLGIALAMDAAVVSMVLALAGSEQRRLALDVAMYFGGAQAIMVWLGSLVGTLAMRWLAAYGGYVAGAVFFVLGVRMWWAQAEDEGNGKANISWREKLLLALATSIDAIVAGVTLPMRAAPLLAPIVIGVVTAVLCAAAVGLAAAVSRRRTVWAMRLGGSVLIGLGLHAALA